MGPTLKPLETMYPKINFCRLSSWASLFRRQHFQRLQSDLHNQQPPGSNLQSWTLAALETSQQSQSNQDDTSTGPVTEFGPWRVLTKKSGQSTTISATACPKSARHKRDVIFVSTPTTIPRVENWWRHIRNRLFFSSVRRRPKRTNGQYWQKTRQQKIQTQLPSARIEPHTTDITKRRANSSLTNGLSPQSSSLPGPSNSGPTHNQE